MSVAAEPRCQALAEVHRLTSALTDRVLHARMMGAEITQQQIQTLAEAAALLQEYGEPWPPMLTQALHELIDANREGDAAPATDQPADEGGIKGFLARARRRMG